MSKSEIDFITKFYGIVINGVPATVHYNGTRHYVDKKEIEKFKPLFTSLEAILENAKPIIQQKKIQEKTGGLLPLIALIPLIASVAGGLGGITAGVATAVAKSNENKEQVRHNSEMERIAKEGQGFDDNISEDEEIEELKYCINKLKGSGFLFV
jgi:hypothetical protein